MLLCIVLLYALHLLVCFCLHKIFVQKSSAHSLQCTLTFSTACPNVDTDGQSVELKHPAATKGDGSVRHGITLLLWAVVPVYLLPGTTPTRRYTVSAVHNTSPLSFCTMRSCTCIKTCCTRFSFRFYGSMSSPVNSKRGSPAGYHRTGNPNGLSANGEAHSVKLNIYQQSPSYGPRIIKPAS